MKKKVKKQPKYVYQTSQMEIKYRILMNVTDKDGKPDWERFHELKAGIGSTGKCPEGATCQCDWFLNRDKEGPCKGKLYTKVLRDEDAQAKYADDTPKFDDDEAVAKKKKQRREAQMNEREPDEYGGDDE